MANARVLVIDDTAQVREAFKALLESEDYEFHEADNGEDGLKLAAELLPDLIILDVMMPGMNGFETCQAIRRNPSISQIPVLMVTALDDKENTVKGLESGADDFINKPVDKLIFLSRIKTITKLNRYRVLREKEEMLEQTLNGVVELLVDLITLTPDICNDDTRRLAKTAQYLIKRLKLKREDELLHAVNLMGIGQFVVPVDLYRKKAAGNTLSPSEREILGDVKNISIKLLDRIPGFDFVRKIIQFSDLSYKDLKDNKYGLNDPSFLGHLIYCATDFNELLVEGHSPKSAEIEMKKRGDAYHPKIISILTYFKPRKFSNQVQEITVAQLKIGMLCSEDIKSKNGTSILKKGEVINQANLESIMVFNKGMGVEQPLKMMVPEDKD